MKVNVKQKDIDEGVQGSENSCALALAVRRAFNTHNVYVHYFGDDGHFSRLRIKVDNEYYSHSHIDKAEHCDNFIDWFDNGMLGEDGCEPFKFNIDTTRTTI